MGAGPHGKSEQSYTCNSVALSHHNLPACSLAVTMCSPVWLTRLVSVVGVVLSSLLLAPVLITQTRGGDYTNIPFLAYLQVHTAYFSV